MCAIYIGGRYRALRTILAAFTIVLLAWTLWSVYQALSTTPDQIKTVSYDLERATSFDMARKDIDGFFQTGILLLAGLWSVAVVKKDDRLSRKDGPEIVMFAVATLLLIGFLFVDQEYGRLLERLYWDTQSFISKDKMFIDLFGSPYISLHHDSLFLCFYTALAATSITILSLCLLKGDDRA